MKKLFTLITLFAGTVAAMGTDYTDKLVVNINNTATVPVTTTISVEEQPDGKYSLQLKNFMLTAGKNPEDVMPVGTINISDVDGTSAGNTTMLSTSQSIKIENGDTPGIDFWMGSMLPEVPVNVKAEMAAERLYALITINMPGIGDIEVVFGDVYQMANSGFELFHTATSGDVTSDEPDNWHSFMSCTGAFASLVSTVPHTFISQEARPGSAGTSSVLIKSGKVLGIVVANGTMTNGRLQAGAMSATDPKNCAFIDITSEDTDTNGDLFHNKFYGKPDSMSVWVKFTQETPQTDYPYATVTAVITDGSYYQEPVDKDYTDIIVARAANATIESKDGVWQKLTIPFDYEPYTDKDAKTILMTFSTNAGAGKGTGNDELYVDDLEMIYNCSATGITIKGTPVDGFGTAADTVYEVIVDGDNADVDIADIAVTTNGKGARVTMEKADVDCIGGGSDVIITVTSADLKKNNTYCVKTRSAQYAGINNAAIGAGGKEEVKAIYNVNGQQIKSPAKGSICIVKYTNGKTVKKIVK